MLWKHRQSSKHLPVCFSPLRVYHTLIVFFDSKKTISSSLVGTLFWVKSETLNLKYFHVFAQRICNKICHNVCEALVGCKFSESLIAVIVHIKFGKFHSDYIIGKWFQCNLSSWIPCKEIMYCSVTYKCTPILISIPLI